MDCHHNSQTIDNARARYIDFHNRMGLAIGALDAVRDLCCEAAQTEGNTLGHVDADNFACLLGLIVDEMRDAHERA